MDVTHWHTVLLWAAVSPFSCTPILSGPWGQDPPRRLASYSLESGYIFISYIKLLKRVLIYQNLQVMRKLWCLNYFLGSSSCLYKFLMLSPFLGGQSDLKLRFTLSLALMPSTRVEIVFWAIYISYRIRHRCWNT